MVWPLTRVFGAKLCGRASMLCDFRLFLYDLLAALAQARLCFIMGGVSLYQVLHDNRPGGYDNGGA